MPSFSSRKKKGKKKTSKAEGLFKQIHKTLKLLTQNRNMLAYKPTNTLYRTSL